MMDGRPLQRGVAVTASSQAGTRSRGATGRPPRHQQPNDALRARRERSPMAFVLLLAAADLTDVSKPTRMAAQG